MIQIENIIKSYNNKEVLNIPQLTIEKGELIGIVGNNGAGKSTLFRLLLDLIAPDSGIIKLKDTPVNKTEEWKDYTGSYLDNTFLLGYLTPVEYFNFVAGLSNLKKDEAAERLELFRTYLGDDNLANDKYIRNLSSGNQQKVGITAALLHQPELVILDEPFNFLDPTAQQNTKKLLSKIHANSETTILVSSHNLEHLLTICSRIILLENGLILKDVKGNAEIYHDEIMTYFLNETEKENE